MKNFLTGIVGTVGGVGFLCAGVAILVWDIGKLQQARESRDWPRVGGKVVESSIDTSRRERRANVVYTYDVNGVVALVALCTSASAGTNEPLATVGIQSARRRKDRVLQGRTGLSGSVR
jgi:hypothetical protein